MPRRTIEVAAACRLHFGLFSFGGTAERQFGGMGAMVEPGALRVRISPAERFFAAGPLAHRAEEVVSRMVGSPQGITSSPALPPCSVETVLAPPHHVGLGVGTQFALAVAAGVRQWHGGDVLPPVQLAAMAGRGKRSAIGTHGFFHGGWLVESGKLAGDTLGPLGERIEIPDQWRFVLIVPRGAQGLHGASESQAFAELPSVPAQVTDRLKRMALDEIVPAVRAADFDAVGPALYRFNHQAGLCYAARQHGAYADARTAALVERLRSWNVAGVGQSSWGPTIFALERDAAAASDLAERCRHDQLSAACEVIVAAPANTGAHIAQVE